MKYIYINETKYEEKFVYVTFGIRFDKQGFYSLYSMI